MSLTYTGRITLRQMWHTDLSRAPISPIDGMLLLLVLLEVEVVEVEVGRRELLEPLLADRALITLAGSIPLLSAI